MKLRLAAVVALSLVTSVGACQSRKPRVDPPSAEDLLRQAALAATYPTDTAVGYAAGDLRGLAWVELQPRR